MSKIKVSHLAGGAYALMTGGFLFGMCRAASLSEAESDTKLRLVSTSQTSAPQVSRDFAS